MPRAQLQVGYLSGVREIVVKYQKIPCACGRLIGFNNYRRHLRRCYDGLKALATEGRDVRLLDERPKEERLRRPVP